MFTENLCLSTAKDNTAIEGMAVNKNTPTSNSTGGEGNSGSCFSWCDNPFNIKTCCPLLLCHHFLAVLDHSKKIYPMPIIHMTYPPPKKNNNNPPLIHGVGLGIYYLLSLVVGMKIEKNISCALPKDVSQRNEEDLLPDVPTIYNDCSRQQELPVGKKGRQRESDSDQSFEP